jgi:hypothetical protein
MKKATWQTGVDGKIILEMDFKGTWCKNVEWIKPAEDTPLY